MGLVVGSEGEDIGLVLRPQRKDMKLYLEPEVKDTSRFVAVDSKVVEAHRDYWVVGRIPRSAGYFPRMVSFGKSALWRPGTILVEDVEHLEYVSGDEVGSQTAGIQGGEPRRRGDRGGVGNTGTKNSRGKPRTKGP